MKRVPVPPSELANPEHPRWRFEPIDRVGSGATSDVWRARDAVSERLVALKIARDDASAACLSAEAERLACALSPHLPELLAVGRVPVRETEEPRSGAVYLATTWMEGLELDPSVARPLEERRVIATAIARDIGEAL